VFEVCGLTFMSSFCALRILRGLTTINSHDVSRGS
jgi:hypothetical protein